MIINYVVSNIENVEIWSLEDVKNYLRILHQYDDKLIVNLTATAIEAAELFTGLNFNRKIVNCKLINVSNIIRLKYIPILKINQVLWLKKNDQPIKIDDFGYIYTDNLCLSVNANYVGADIEINYQAGYSKHIPRSIQHGILMHVASMYENPESAVILSTQIKDLYMPYRKIKI